MLQHIFCAAGSKKGLKKGILGKKDILSNLK